MRYLSSCQVFLHEVACDAKEDGFSAEARSTSKGAEVSSKACVNARRTKSKNLTKPVNTKASLPKCFCFCDLSPTWPYGYVR